MTAFRLPVPHVSPVSLFEPPSALLSSAISAAQVARGCGGGRQSTAGCDVKRSHCSRMSHRGRPRRSRAPAIANPTGVLSVPAWSH
jgi:hypothetical protein